MATLGTELLTIVDHIKRTQPDGSIAPIVEALMTRKSVIKDMVFREGNLTTGHRVTTRTGLPSVTYRKINEGVSPSKSKTDQFDESVGMMECWSVLDVENARLNGNDPGLRASEDAAFLESLEKEAETGVFYNSTSVSPEKWTGLSPRMDSTSDQAGGHIIKHDTYAGAAASGNDSTSIWLVGWGPRSVYGIFPKGSKGGIEYHDMGIRPWDDGTGKKFRAYVGNWNWKLGVVVEDWRYVVRICNIDATNLSATGNLLIQSMVRAYHKLESTSGVKPVWYGNRDIGTYLHLQALDSTKQSTLSIDNVAGEPMTHVLGIPFRETDAILSTEAPVS